MAGYAVDVNVTVRINIMQVETNRQRADRLGHKTYPSDRPCRNGHLTTRNTLSGSCITCTYERTKERRARIKANRKKAGK